MNKDNKLMKSLPFAFWGIFIILFYHYVGFGIFDRFNFIKSHNEHKVYMQSFNNKLNGNWYRTSDSLCVKFISNPSNVFVITNSVYELQDAFISPDTIYNNIGSYKIEDVEVTDTTNNIYEGDYIKTYDGHTKYISCNIVLLNDSTILVSNSCCSTVISDTFRKIK